MPGPVPSNAPVRCSELTNSVRFDPASGAGSGNSSSSTQSATSFGKLNTLLVQPRQMQFALRYEF